MRFFKRRGLRILQFLLLTQPLLIFTARSYGDLSSQHWTPGLCSWHGTGITGSQGIPPHFSTTCESGTTHAPSTTPNPTGSYSQKLWGFIFLVLEPWTVVWPGAGVSSSCGVLPPHVNVALPTLPLPHLCAATGRCSFCLSRRMWFFKYLVFRLPYYSVS